VSPLPDGNRPDRLAARGRGHSDTEDTGINTSVSSAVGNPSIGVFITRLRWPRAIRCQCALLYLGRALCLRAALKWARCVLPLQGMHSWEWPCQTASRDAGPRQSLRHGATLVDSRRMLVLPREIEVKPFSMGFECVAGL
jgi:hypothetical protein